MYVRVNLVDGSAVSGGTNDMDEVEVARLKDSLGDIVKGSEGWQINLELPDGGWAIFPKASILYIELVPER